MRTLIEDVRFCLRTLRKTPGFTVVVILTLALDIGASTAIFSIVDAALLRPLPFPGSGRLVKIMDNAPGAGLHDFGTSQPVPAGAESRPGLPAADRAALGLSPRAGAESMARRRT